MRRPVALLALVLSLTLAGCEDKPTAAPAGGQTPSATSGTGDAPATATDVCPLITAADLSTLLGYEVAFTRDPSNGCSYDSVKADARTEPSVGITNTVQFADNGGLAGAKQGAEATTKGTAVDLPDLGAGAFVVTSGPDADFTICLASAEAKGQQVTVTVTGGGSENKAKLAPVATKVLTLAVSKL